MPPRIMPNPYGRPRPPAAFANWLILCAIGLALFAFGGNQTAGFALTMIGGVGALFSWPDVKRVRRAEQKRRREDV